MNEEDPIVIKLTVYAATATILGIVILAQTAGAVYRAFLRENK